VNCTFSTQAARLSTSLNAGGWAFGECNEDTLDYGFEIEGIVGMDFLTKAGAVVDLAKLEIYQTSTSNRGESP
jgi:hypothetical protein